MIFEKRAFRDFDKTLFLMTLVVLVIGMAAVYSATHPRVSSIAEDYIAKQILWVLMGLVLFLVVVSVSYQKFIDISYIFYSVMIIILVLVLIMGRARLGAQRWFSIGGFAFQPSEFIKIALILALANYCGSHRGTISGFRDFVMCYMILFIPFGLVLVQPDLGTALTLLPIFFGIVLISGANIKYIIGLIAAGLAAMPFFWHFLRDYQKQRLLVFINPNSDPLGAGYTIIQSKIAVGSGGLVGKGWLNGSQGQLNFLPEHHTDFIFSVIGEELGLLGGLALVLLYFFIIQRALRIAALTSDIYGKAIATGVAMMLSVQVVVNIAMTIGLMPVVGIPLPMVSYGGSSMIATLFSIGLLINVGMRRSTF
ncbi:MAG: rod shape-determining protein RodA [Candidatus Omnitrophica bacterium]|nr:rod shape-determining protein RodA [Candidatus Omnitrophota bacterium]